MEAPGIFIFAAPIKHGDRTYTFADRYDREKVKLDDMRDRTMKKSGYVVPLTRETYANAIAHRPVGTVGSGFTRDFLLENGIIDINQASQGPDFPLGAVEYRGCLIVTRKSGNFTRYQILNDQNEPMRPAMCKTLKAAQAFIDGLEEGDVVHVRSGAGEPDKPN